MGHLHFIEKDNLSGMNPDRPNISKDTEWIHFKLIKDVDYEVFTGLNAQNIYQIIVNMDYESWCFRVMDFIAYIKENPVNGLISISHDLLALAKEKYKGHSYKDKFLRPYEKQVLIHSTSLKNWMMIQKDYLLKAWSVLNDEKEMKRLNPVGKLLGDPKEYRQYIMLGTGITSEIVVASTEKDTIIYDIHTPYTPGARLYLDANKMAKDGLLIRDGAHIKVRENLDLNQYMLLAATKEILDEKREVWTPHTFSKEADLVFMNRDKL